MIKAKAPAIALLAVLMLWGCRKNDKRNPSPFIADGYWEGNFFTGGSVHILNLQNGTSRLYFVNESGDTASAYRKFYGNYSTAGNSFTGHYETSEPSGSDAMDLLVTPPVRNTLNGQFFVDELYSFSLELNKRQ